jgi:ABC-type polysaccharide/polyol phosphate export permease
MLNRFFQDIKKYYRYSIVSAKSQLKTEVANSYLNWIWWILEPLCFMLIYTFIFGYLFDSKELYFPIYIFIGLSMWTFFNNTVQASVKMIKNNKSVVSKVYFPKYVLLLSRIWVNGFKMLVSFAIVIMMMILFRVPISWNVFWIVPILLILAVFTFGCSCFLMHYGVYINDLSNVISIVTRMLFYLTGIFYNLEKRIPQYGQILNRNNPVAFMISSARNVLLYRQAPLLWLLLVWAAVSILLAVLGVRKIYKEENSYVKAI